MPLKPLTAKPDEKTVRLRIICVKPPNPKDYNAEFGLEAEDWVLDAGKAQPDGSFHFECALWVKPNQKTQQPNFLGPHAHGSPSQRFLYISWRHREADGSVYVRKMKIHLSSITWEQIEEVERTGGVLEVAVPGTAQDGGLKCGSVAPLGEGWTVRPANSKKE